MSTPFNGDNLTCIRGSRLVFKGLSFALSPGGALLLTGANGSGKTSLLRLMAGLATPAEGASRKATRVPGLSIPWTPAEDASRKATRTSGISMPKQNRHTLRASRVYLASATPLCNFWRPRGPRWVSSRCAALQMFQ